MYTIAEAAHITGRTKKAIRNRVDRGQLRAALQAGVRRIPRSELERHGLVPRQSDPLRPDGQGEQAPRAPLLEAVHEILDRLDRQAAQLTELRALTVDVRALRSERDHLDAALRASQGRVVELEAKLADLGQVDANEAVDGQAKPRFDVVERSAA